MKRNVATKIKSMLKNFGLDVEYINTIMTFIKKAEKEKISWADVNLQKDMYEPASKTSNYPASSLQRRLSRNITLCWQSSKRNVIYKTLGLEVKPTPKILVQAILLGIENNKF